MRRNMPSETGYELLDHTADIRVRVWGGSLEQLFRTAAEAMADLMVDRGAVESRRSLPVRVTGADAEELLVAWLEEILYAFETEGFVVGLVEVAEVGSRSVRGMLHGDDFDNEKHEVRNVIKAVTYHNLEVKESDRGVEASIVFDV